MAISSHTPCVQPPDIWDTVSPVKGEGILTDSQYYPSPLAEEGTGEGGVNFGVPDAR